MTSLPGGKLSKCRELPRSSAGLLHRSSRSSSAPHSMNGTSGWVAGVGNSGSQNPFAQLASMENMMSSGEHPLPRNWVLCGSGLQLWPLWRDTVLLLTGILLGKSAPHFLGTVIHVFLGMRAANRGGMKQAARCLATIGKARSHSSTSGWADPRWRVVLRVL